MAQNIKDIETQALSLDLEARARLAAKLLLSLEEPSDSEVERLWIAEAERRLEEYHQGKVKAIPAEDVFKRLIAELA